jgi:hypothetical protein
MRNGIIFDILEVGNLDLAPTKDDIFIRMQNDATFTRMHFNEIFIF